MLDHTALAKAARNLAPLPATVARLASLLATDTYSVSDVEAIVRLDPPLTGRLLQYANSAAGASLAPIGTVRDAIIHVGVGPMLSLAMAVTVRSDLMRALPAYGLSEGELWRHAVATALAAEVVARTMKCAAPPEAFTASLLHDIGKLILARFLDADQLRWLAAAREQGNDSSLRAEVEVLGVHHGELGGLIAIHWNLPPRIVVGITHHHTPAHGRDVICDIVHVANVLANRAGTGHATSLDVEVETNALERLGVEADRLPLLERTVSDRLAQAVARFG